MVMVRRTGSDLQPAATGYIYRSDNNGPASVIKLGEGDINQRLDNLPKPLYQQSQAYVAHPVAVESLQKKEDDDSKAASQAKEYVIPVIEIAAEDSGIENSKQIDDGNTGEYASDFGDYKGDFDDYIVKDFGNFGDGFHHNEHGGGSDFSEQGQSAYGEKGQKGYASSHHYGKGGAGDYHTEKYESYSTKAAGEHGKHYDEADSYGASHSHGNSYKGGNHGHKAAHSKGEETDGFHKLFNKDVLKKDDDFYDEKGLKGGFHKYADGHAYHGSGAEGFKKGDFGESAYDEDGFGKHGYHDHGSEGFHGISHSAKEDGDNYFHHGGDFGAKDGYFDGKGYGYHIKH